MNVWRFTVNGPVVVQGRPRKGKWGQIYDPSKREKAVLSLALINQKVKNKMPLLLEPLSVRLSFYGMERGDLDNAIKANLDAANGVLWGDDKQIVAICAYLYRRDSEPRTTWEIRTVEKDK